MNRVDQRQRARWEKRMDKWNSRPFIPRMRIVDPMVTVELPITRGSNFVESIEYLPREVFRIEHPVSGKGPFSHHTEQGSAYQIGAMEYMDEPQLRNPSSWHYAFVSIEALWRNIKSVVLLRQCGFHICVYTSHRHIVLPDGQVGFDKAQAICLRSEPVHQFPFESYF